MTTLEFYEGLAAEKRSDRVRTQRKGHFASKTPNELAFRFGGYTVVSRKKKGAGKGYKETLGWVWRDYAGYREALEELFPREYALMLCREHMDYFTGDRWWDTPNYRADAIRDYRNDINVIRSRYGLSRSDVAPYMRVE